LSVTWSISVLSAAHAQRIARAVSLIRRTILSWHVIYDSPAVASVASVRSVRLPIYVIWIYAAIFWNTTPGIARVLYEAVTIGAVYFDVARIMILRWKLLTSLSRAL
jgi:hypothetical protein